MTIRPVVMTLLLTAVVCRLTAAQDDPPSPYFSPWLTHAGLEQFLEELGPADRDREAVIRTLYDELLQTYEQRSAPARESARRWQPDRKTWRAWQRDRRELEARFEADVPAILDARQAVIWRGAMQGLRRQRVLGEMKLSDPAHRRIPDLIAIVDEIELTGEERDAVAALALQYSDELDEVLRLWETTITDIMTAMNAAVNPPNNYVMNRPGVSPQREPGRWRRNYDEYDRLYQQFVAMIVQVREITDRSAEALAGLLEPSHRNRFRDAALTIKYPNVYLPSPIDTLMDAVRADQTMAPDKRELLESVYADYLGAREIVRRRTVETLERWERPAEFRRRRRRAERILAEGGDFSEVREDNPVIERFYERRELVRTACLSMRSLFTAEEFETLPAGAQVVLSWELR